MRYLIIALLVALSAGCATKPASINSSSMTSPSKLYAYQEKGDGYAEVVVLRDSGFLGSACDVTIYIEGRRAAEIGSGEKAQFYVPAGALNLGAGFAGKGLCSSGSIQALQVNVQAGGRSLFRFSGDMNGSYISPYFDYEGR